MSRKSKGCKSGFVYIWRDRKHKRYYIGSHWGTSDDGYVCSSSWMKQAYKKRPDDFRRRIIALVTTSRKELFEEEQRWLGLIRDEDMGKKYYNLIKFANHHWSGDPDKAADVAHKLSVAKTGRPGWPHTPESKQKLSEAHKGKPKSDEHRRNMSLTRIGRPSKMKGKQFSEEARKNMGGQNRGKTASEETSRKMSIAIAFIKWYTDGVRDCRLRQDAEIPDGFRLGRTKGLTNLPTIGCRGFTKAAKATGETIEDDLNT